MARRIDLFIKKLAREETNKLLFNQYNEVCKHWDDRTAPGVRQQNLRLFLNTYLELEPKVFLILPNPTALEGKRSGVPLMNVSCFDQAEFALPLERSFEKATKSKRKVETSVASSVVWDAIRILEEKPFIWWALPFHPFKKGSPKADRNPTNEELIAHKKFLYELIKIYKPKHLISLGRDAEEALDIQGLKSTYFLHPTRLGVDGLVDEIKKL